MKVNIRICLVMCVLMPYNIFAQDKNDFKGVYNDSIIPLSLMDNIEAARSSLEKIRLEMVNLKDKKFKIRGQQGSDLSKSIDDKTNQAALEFATILFELRTELDEIFLANKSLSMILSDYSKFNDDLISEFENNIIDSNTLYGLTYKYIKHVKLVLVQLKSFLFTNESEFGDNLENSIRPSQLKIEGLIEELKGTEQKWDIIQLLKTKTKVDIEVNTIRLETEKLLSDKMSGYLQQLRTISKFLIDDKN